MSAQPNVYAHSNAFTPSDKYRRRFAAREVVMMDSDLSMGARMVYQYLDNRARGTDSCFPKQETIARDLGISRRTVQRHIQALESAGYIRASRQAKVCGANTYDLAARDKMAQPMSHVTDLSQPDATQMAQPGGAHPYSLNTEHLEERNTPPKPPERKSAPVSEEEFRELEEGYDRHLKHHRTEPRDTVLQTLFGMATEGRFNWERFRERHAGYCQSQARAGWGFCTLTFLGWVRAGMPPAPPTAIDQGRKNAQSPSLADLLEASGD